MTNKSGSALRPLMKYAKPYGGLFAASMILAVASVAGTLYIPVMIGDGIDMIIKAGSVNFSELLPILIKIAIIAVITAAVQWIMSLCTNKITFCIVRNLRSAAYKKLGRLPLSYVDSHAHGDIISRIITDIEQVSDGLLMGFAQLFTGVCTIFGTLVFMLSINVKITLAVVVITPVSLFAAGFISKNTFRFFNAQSVIRGDMTSIIEELNGNQKTVSAFCYEAQAERRFDDVNQSLNKVGVKAVFFSSLTNPCTRFVNGLVYTSVGIIGAVSAIAGGFSVGNLTSFLTYANQYTKPFNEISGVITELQSALASARRVFEILEAEEEVPDNNNDAKAEKCIGEVDIENVFFSYDSEIKLIENFNLHVKPGQHTAIVGPTGCGKTTVINLLMRFYDTDSGEIKIDGRRITDFTRASMRSMYGMVLQETWLKTATVKENIRYGKPDATDEEIIKAAKSAHCHSFIKRLPDGYDTVVSDSSGLISAGQKQLICIARIMLSLPPMLILDEATSSIDTRTEILIQRAFDKMMKGRTCFIIAHRLSTIKNADMIIVMDSGHIVEQGSHDELMKKNGFYARLYNSQFAIC